MYITTQKGVQPAMHSSLTDAIVAATATPGSPSWIYELEVSRLGTLKRLEVPRGKIIQTQPKGIDLILNRTGQPDEPLDGQLYFTADNGQVTTSVYRRKQISKSKKRLGRFVQEVKDDYIVNMPDVAAKYLQQNVFSPWTDFEQEELWVLLLNARHRLTHTIMCTRGTATATLGSPTVVFREAIRLNAVKMMVAHNHPTNVVDPSNDDLLITSRWSDVAKLVDIELLDHLIIGKDNWISLKAKGYMK